MTKSEVYIRAKSGFIRLFSPWDHFMYNVLVMVILTTGPWLFLSAPNVFPGGDMALGILIATILGTAIIYVYSALASTMPVCGGDYIYNSRIIHPSISFALTFVSYPMFCIYWNAMAGWTISQQAIAPFLTFLGYYWNNPTIIGWGTWFASVWGYRVVATLGNLTAFLLMLPGLRPYLRYVNGPLFWLVIISIVTVGGVFAFTPTSTFITRYNNFAAYFGQPSYHEIINMATTNGFYLKAPFSWYATLGIMPLAWYYLAWAQMATPNMGEIKGAEKVKRVMLVNQASLWFGGIYTIIVALQLLAVGGADFIKAFSWAFAAGQVSLPVIPFYEYFAALLTSNPVILFLIIIGFLANAWQLNINCFIANSRYLVAQGFDRILPTKVSEMSKRWRSSPIYALIAIFVGTEILIFFYEYIAYITLSQMFSYMFLFALTSIAGAIAPWRIPKIWNASPASKYKIGPVPAITIAGIVSTIFFGIMAYYMATVPGLGVAYPIPLATIIGLIVACFIYYWIKRYYLMRKGINIDLTFKEVPPE